MMIIKNRQVGRPESRRLPRSEGCCGADIGFILASAILALFLAIPGAMAQENELACHYSGQTYPFNTTPCRDDWIYAWTATFVDTGLDAGEFVEGPIPDTCSVNWTAPVVYQETLVNITVLVTNVEDEDDIFDSISCIAMDNITVLVCPLFCIEGYKINNCTGDGLEDWTITLYNETNAEINTTMTNETGFYSFCGLKVGYYEVEETLESGWTNVTPTRIGVTLTDDNATDQNFTNTPLLCIEGYKIDAYNGDGIEGWTITLTNDTGAEIASTTTNETGWYSFCDLAPGNYEVCETVEDGWTNVTATCIEVELECEDAVNKNFTNTQLLCIEGYKLDDCTGDGLEGWTIRLFDDQGSEIDNKTTDGTGWYSFCGLVPGSYEVCEDMEPGWINVTA
ncbi:MAG: MSCRAMM family adhesin SdrC, partial [Methanothrix sp.]|nr:MSCRAMM family adhesin SdrC [Methanothrix sp.]